MKLGIVAMPIAGVVLAACGGLTTGGSAQAHPSTPRPTGRAGFGNAVAGQLMQLSATQVVLSSQSGSVSVTYDGSTRVLRTASSSLAQVKQGACVTATGQKDASGVVDATTVNLMADLNGACAQPNAGGAGGQGRPPGGRAPAGAAFVRGTVIGVSATGLTVQDATGAAVPVNVPATARVSRRRWPRRP